MNTSASNNQLHSRPLLPQQMVDELSRRIGSGVWPPGARLPTEPELMQAFGVGRGVVREALSQLQARGLVHTRQGLGSFVLAATPELAVVPPQAQALKLQHKLAMLELRLTLEAEAAALAAQRRQPHHLQAMVRARKAYETDLASGAAGVEADFRFHEAVAQASGNVYFGHVLLSLSSATIPREEPSKSPRGARARRVPARRFGEPTPQLLAHKSNAGQEHAAVYEAIWRGDAALARAAMVLHLSNSRQRLLASLDASP